MEKFRRYTRVAIILHWLIALLIAINIALIWSVEYIRPPQLEYPQLSRRMGEEGKVRIRSQRRDGMEAVKKAQKEGAITEDDQERSESEIQKLTDKYVKEIDTHVLKKEHEIMTV